MSVQVAVRVRPFNDREKAKQAKLIVRMDGGTTYVTDPETGKEKSYEFDFSIWSHDQEHGQFRTQDRVYEEIGVPLFNDFWENDYNVCLFAYGQSGSGKSFSMTGKVDDKQQRGIIPRITESILAHMAEEKSSTVKFTCTVGMLEIYLEEIQDLLIPKNKRPKKGLQIAGGAVQKLTHLPVNSVAEILAALDKGHENATIKPTGLNPESSRGHSVFEVKLKKIVIDPDGKECPMEKTMRLIDLAGSERVDKVLELGGDAREIAQRVEEGKSINQSLTALGNCITKVAVISQITDRAAQKKALDAVAWRETKLTHLLRDSLAGNCKTIMIAAVSPSASEFLETCSTLRYANEVKKIKVQVKAAAAGGSKLQKQLIAQEKEIRALKKQLEAAKAGGGGGGGVGALSVDPKVDAEMRAKLADYERKRSEQEAKDKERDAAERKRNEEFSAKMAELVNEREAKQAASKRPHLKKVVDDPNLLGRLIESLGSGEERVCGYDPSVAQIILEPGVRVEKKHCTFKNDGKDNVTLTPIGKNAILLNSQLVTAPAVLRHLDRLAMGQNNFFIFSDPKEEAKMTPEQVQEQYVKYDFTFCRKEALAEQLKGFQMANQKEEEEAKRKQDEEWKKKEMELKKREEEMLAKQRVEQEKERERERAEFKKKQEDFMKQLAQEQQKDQDRLRREFEQKMRAEQAEADRKLKEQQDSLNRKIAEEQKKLAEIKRKEEEEKQRELDQQHFTEGILAEVIPEVYAANVMCAEMSIESSFDLKLKPIRDVNDFKRTKTDVCVEVTEKEKPTGPNQEQKVKRTAQWNVFKWNKKYGEMCQLHAEFQQGGLSAIKERLENEATNPFIVSSDSNVQIGEVIAALNYIYNNMSMGEDEGDHYTIIGTEAHMDLKVIPTFLGPTADDITIAEDIKGMHKLHAIELRIKVNSISNLPAALASNCYVSLTFPSFVDVQLVANGKDRIDGDTKGGAGGGASGKRNDDDDDVGKKKEQVILVSQPNKDKDGLLDINPKIMFDKTVRINNVTTPQVEEWLKDQFLVIQVWGATPSTEAALKRREEFRKKQAAEERAKKAADAKDNAADEKERLAAEAKLEHNDSAAAAPSLSHSTSSAVDSKDPEARKRAEADRASFEEKFRESQAELARLKEETAKAKESERTYESYKKDTTEKVDKIRKAREEANKQVKELQTGMEKLNESKKLMEEKLAFAQKELTEKAAQLKKAQEAAEEEKKKAAAAQAAAAAAQAASGDKKSAPAAGGDSKSETEEEKKQRAAREKVAIDEAVRARTKQLNEEAEARVEAERKARVAKEHELEELQAKVKQLETQKGPQTSKACVIL